MNNKILIFGSGIVGQCWTALFSRGKFCVTLYDIKNTALAVEDVQINKLPLLEKFDMLYGKTAQEFQDLISGTSNLQEALKKVHYIQECVPEELNIKIKVHNLISSTLQKTNEVIIGSSSSNLCASLFSKNENTKNRSLIVHPINPPFAIPLVELVPSPTTETDVLTRTKELMILSGMIPVVLKKEIDGFAVNRLQYALLGEAYRLVEDEILTPGDVDLVVSKGLGLRWSFMGPFQTIDLNANGVKDYCFKFSSSVERILKTQDNNRQWSTKTYTKLDKYMRSETNLSDLKQKMKWRDWRLMKLATHQKDMEQKNWMTV